MPGANGLFLRWPKEAEQKGQMAGGLTWAHAEDLVKVGTDAHLLVKLRGLGQVGAGLKVRHGEDVGPSLAGGCGQTTNVFYLEKKNPKKLLHC